VDIARTGFVELRKKKRMALAAAAAVAVTIVVFALSRLEPAVPTVERTTLWTDTVKRGTMIRDVRGSGRLVPEEIRWIAASTDGHG
jgi:HlyD family secretion protein